MSFDTSFTTCFLKGHKEAETLYREALTIGRKVFDSDHPLIANWANNLGFLLKTQVRKLSILCHYSELQMIRISKYTCTCREGFKKQSLCLRNHWLY